MDWFRFVVFALLNLVLLVNSSAIRRKRFGSNYSIGFGKRDRQFPGFGKRPYDYENENVQDLEKDNSLNSANEQKTSYWDTKPRPLPDWNGPKYNYPDYDSLSQRNVDTFQDYVDPDGGYIRRNPNSIHYGNDNQESPFFEDGNEHSYNRRLVSGGSSGAYNKLDDDLAGKMPGEYDRQNPSDDQKTELAQMLKRLLSQRDQENNISGWK